MTNGTFTVSAERNSAYEPGEGRRRWEEETDVTGGRRCIVQSKWAP